METVPWLTKQMLTELHNLMKRAIVPKAYSHSNTGAGKICLCLQLHISLPNARGSVCELWLVYRTFNFYWLLGHTSQSCHGPLRENPVLAFIPSSPGGRVLLSALTPKVGGGVIEAVSLLPDLIQF